MLIEKHQVIAVDLQGHGRTADIDRPLDVRLTADDVAALIDDFTDVRGLRVPALVVAADADMAPPIPLYGDLRPAALAFLNGKS